MYFYYYHKYQNFSTLMTIVISQSSVPYYLCLSKIKTP